MLRLQNSIKQLFPSSFALVMATGIISIACFIIKIPYVPFFLFYFNTLAYIILFLMLFAKILFYFKSFKSDFSDHSKGAGYLSFVAGTNILGCQFALIEYNFTISKILYFVGLISWLLFIYSFIIIVTIKKVKPSLENGINGIWLLIVVSTQSVSILGVILVNHLPFLSEFTLILSFILFLVGCVHYLIIITLIFYRLTFFSMCAEEFAPPYWINMGAVAIITLAGSLLIANADHSNFIFSMQYFIKGLSLMFWATGLWWIPIILFLGVWRHILYLIPINYHPQYWGMVFPLGMFTVSTIQLSEVTGLEFLKIIPPYILYFALFAWVTTFSGLIYTIFRKLIYKKNNNFKI